MGEVSISLEDNGEEIPQEPVNVRCTKWAVNEKPCFLAADFIAATNVLKGNRIIKGNRVKLPCDSIMQSDPTKYPPVPIADKKRGRRRVDREAPTFSLNGKHERRTF